MIEGKNSSHKLFWIGNDKGADGVGVLLVEKWVDKVPEVTRGSDMILLLKFIVAACTLNIISVYAPQVGLSTDVKDNCYEILQSTVKDIPEGDFLLYYHVVTGMVAIGCNSDGFVGF